MPVTVHYRVDFDDGENVVFALESAAAPFAFAVGHFVDPSGWTGNPLPPEERYEVIAVEHQLTFFGGLEAQHNIVVSIRPVARARPL
jgi:hypothetical protein